MTDLNRTIYLGFVIIRLRMLWIWREILSSKEAKEGKKQNISETIFRALV